MVGAAGPRTLVRCVNASGVAQGNPYSGGTRWIYYGTSGYTYTDASISINS